MRPTILPLLTKLYSQPQKSSGNTSVNSLKSEKPPIKSEEMYGIMEQKLRHVCDKRAGGNFLNISSVDILADLTHTQEEIDTVSKSTVKQWKSKEWYKHKSGFITGSIAQQSLNMQNSLDKGLGRKVSSLVKK
ncbi:Carboxypeptidase D [Paramuricea clavata]|uniref:Carboxypeptidase D n=1 Tax=Paramuricea clavata TaxID=317549 RepID=A0A6S7G4Y0_PARCT|nr:Carboxypeptidase D [Paramuricea clavata]